MTFMRALLVLALAAVGCAPPAASQRAEASSAPTLVVLITVDQLRADYLDRWDSQLSGGLARLMREGAHYADAVHDHAITETAPGHASIGSGRFPVHNGIASNRAGVYDPNVALIGVTGAGASPHRFRGSTLADWIAAKHSDTRILSVSVKDRGAILPIGKRVADVYWYSYAGVFTTSDYYRDTLPTWVQRFNALGLPHRYAGREWNLLLPASQYPEPDSVPAENGGVDFLFPHFVSSDSANARVTILNTPFGDEITLAFALAGARALGLGRSDRTDLLAISLSGTDYIGHRFGPDSREVHDQVLRLDRALGVFLDSLFTTVDRRRVVIALTADHGVAPIPEVHGRGARRVDISGLRTLLRSRLIAAGTDSLAILFGSGALDVEWDVLRRDGVDPAPIFRDFAAAARELPGVAVVTTIGELARRDTVGDYIARRWLHMFATDSEAPVVVTLHPYNYWNGIGATHGSPHDYDASVPAIFWGAGVRPGRRDARVRVVDVAPTLARLIGVTPSERIDGRALDAAP